MLPFTNREKADMSILSTELQVEMAQRLNDCTESGFPTAKHLSAYTDSCVRRDPFSLSCRMQVVHGLVVEEVILSMVADQQVQVHEQWLGNCMYHTPRHGEY
ncbi:hypothetical protein AVEN_29197-1 [Araneus ventricosus]|uniref:Uncharacterized protein n=1 Tax=Araneus ventricosus TaxID=182803 RepID=A0A4Y2ALU8_ARAVE|nr:hypothetical protein AVEN_29197-1 [Araneus ventricosus]